MRLWDDLPPSRWAIEHALDFIGGMYHENVVERRLTRDSRFPGCPERFAGCGNDDVERSPIKG
jgi:hypothetical protein